MRVPRLRHCKAFRLCLAVAEHQILGGKHFFFGTRIKKDLVVEEGTLPSEKVPLPMDTLSWQETQVDFS